LHYLCSRASTRAFTLWMTRAIRAKYRWAQKIIRFRKSHLRGINYHRELSRERGRKGEKEREKEGARLNRSLLASLRSNASRESLWVPLAGITLWIPYTAHNGIILYARTYNYNVYYMRYNECALYIWNYIAYFCQVSKVVDDHSGRSHIDSSISNDNFRKSTEVVDSHRPRSVSSCRQEHRRRKISKIRRRRDAEQSRRMTVGPCLLKSK